jgi:RNase P/RNase MRP subunit p30
MFDIIKCKADASAHGFSRLYQLDEVKGRIAQAENLTAATNYKNRKILIMLADHAMDDGAMKIIAEKRNACFLIDLGRLMKIRGIQRAIAISKLRNFLALCVKHNAFYAFASFAENENQIRSPEEMEHIAMLLGLNRGQAKFALKMIGNYL